MVFLDDINCSFGSLGRYHVHLHQARLGCDRWTLLDAHISGCRWYKGTRHAAQVKHTLNLAELHRSPLQPYVRASYLICDGGNKLNLLIQAAWYAMIMCTLVLVFNGWAVFTQGPWRIGISHSLLPRPFSRSRHPAMKPGDGFKSNSTEVGNPIVDTFVTSYLPSEQPATPCFLILTTGKKTRPVVPLFLLLFFGYKLIMRSNMVDYDKMTFDRGFIPRVHEPKPRNWLERLLT